MRPGERPLRRQQGGFAWLVLLAALAGAAAWAATVAQRWSDQASRERERMLLQVGQAYARALAEYRAASPGSEPRYPRELQDLLLDPRFPGTRRHLRRLYPDPFTGRPDWTLVRDARGDIVGLRSRSAQLPWTRVPLRLPAVDLPAAERHSDWLFTPRTSP